MNELHVEDLLEGVVRENPRFTLEGYLFVREALDYAVGQLEAPAYIREELLLGVREYALSQFGPMARRVLMEWGITSCEHIGEMVFCWWMRGSWEKQRKIVSKILKRDMILKRL